MKKPGKLIQVVPFYPLPIATHEKEDYFLISATVMKAKGFECEYVTLRAQGSKMVETIFSKDQAAEEEYKGFKIRRFDSTLRLLNYVRKQNAVVESHLRSFPPSSFVGFLGNPKVIRPFTYVMGSSLPIALFTALIFRRFDRVLAVTPYKYGIYRKYRIPEKRLTLLPLSIDYDFFSQKVPSGHVKEKYRVKDKDKVIIAVANVRKHKRYDVLLKALFVVKKTIPEAKVLIVGDDWLHAQKLASLKEMAAEYGVSDSVVLTGYQPSEVVREMYSFSDVFVHTAENEYQGLVSYEAAAMGIPLCLSAIGSHTSVFKEHALYHDVEDFQKLAENIVTCIKNRNSVEANVRFLKQHMKEWDYTVIARLTGELFDDVLEKYRG